MKDITLSIGGKLSPGDVVGVAYNNCVVFGWYVEPGQYGSLKFITFRMPEAIKKQYDDFIAGGSQGAWLQKKYAKGFQFKNIDKDFITSWSSTNNRAFKVFCPEEFFKDSEAEVQYLKGKEILNNIKFPAK